MERKFESSYEFNDTLTRASQQGKTLRQYIIEREAMLEDPRVKKGFLLEQTAKLHESRLAKEDFMDGAEGMFAVNGFVVADMNIRRPLFKTYAPKHVPFLYGGGAIEVDKGFFMNYNTAPGRLASGNNNKVNLVKSNVYSLESPILPLTLGMFVGNIDLMKADQIGYDIISTEAEAVRLSYQIELEKFAFVGHRGIDGTSTDGASMARGLLNFGTDVAVVQDLETTTDYTLGTKKKLEGMTTEKLSEIFVGEYYKFAEQVGYDESALANKYLLSPTDMRTLLKPANLGSGSTVYRSHLAYIKEQLDLARISINGPEVTFDVLPYLDPYNANTFGFDPLLNEDGTNGTSRIVLYRQDPYVLRLRLALDLTPGAIVYDPINNGMRRNYVAFIGTPLAYYKTVRYIDNGTTNS